VDADLHDAVQDRADAVKGIEAGRHRHGSKRLHLAVVVFLNAAAVPLLIDSNLALAERERLPADWPRRRHGMRAVTLFQQFHLGDVNGHWFGEIGTRSPAANVPGGLRLIRTFEVTPNMYRAPGKQRLCEAI
jgi:hypothetical protein